VPSGDDKPPRALTHGGARRDHRHRDTAGAPITFVEDEVTGRYEGELLDQKRAERDARMRERLAVVETQATGIEPLRRDLRTTDQLVDQHNHVIEFGVKPLLEKLPRQLEAIRLAQHTLDGALTAAVKSSQDVWTGVSRQLQEHNLRLGAVERAQTADGARLSIVERTAADAASLAAKTRSEFVALKKARTADSSVDAKVGSWVRRHASKALLAIAVAVGSAIAGVVGGYLATKFGVSP
jgi:hypothetical protein